jgi:hypothetical protein
MTVRDPLEYVLNRMENAGRSDAPAKNGYGEARRELLEGIAGLRKKLDEKDTEIAELKHDLERYIRIASTEAGEVSDRDIEVRKFKSALEGGRHRLAKQRAEIERLRAVLDEIHIQACLAERSNCEPALSSIAKMALIALKVKE